MPTRVLIVEDQELFRAGARLVVESRDQFEVVGEAHDCSSGEQMLKELRPDILLLDISLPDGEGLKLLNVCREHSPATRTLVLSTHQNQAWVDRAIAAGCAGYLDKTAGVGEILSAIEAIQRGRTVISMPGPEERIMTAPLEEPQPGPTVVTPHSTLLSNRENEVLACIARGLTNQQAADEMFLSVKTIETYRSRLMRKLGLRSRAELFQYAMSKGLIGAETGA